MHYSRLRPDELERRIAAVPVAFVPWGALEWHSAHLPVGLDGLVAEAIASRAATEVGGVVLPPFYLPITALPHRFSVSIRAVTVRAVLDELLDELARVGLRVVVVLSGHYAQGHELVLIEAAEAALERDGLLVLATPPLALLDDAMLDHAGHWETSLLLAIAPDLVDMEPLRRSLPATASSLARETGILGQIPLDSATAADGQEAITRAVAAIKRVVDTLLATGDSRFLHDYYARRRSVYAPFIDRYFKGSWEDAAARWWDDQTAAGRDTEHR